MISEDLEQTKAIAKRFLEHIVTLPAKDYATVVALSGDLGAGKTAFTQAIAKLVGIQESVASPTFVVQKNYKIKYPPFESLVHIDAYRIEDGSELTVIGFKETLLNKEKIIFIEWPEKIIEHIPKDSLFVYFKHINEHSRKINFDYENQ